MNGKPWTAGLVALTCALVALPAAANFIQVRNVELVNQWTQEGVVQIAFDLSLENSWRNELNHDAAWVFVKFRAPGSNHWQHAYLTTNGTAAVNEAPGGKVDLGYSEVNGVTNAVGAFIYSANNQTGTVSYSRTRLTWDYDASGYDWQGGEELDVSVRAIEMVNVAGGSFFVGSGGTESGSFTEGSWESGNNTIPFAITNEAAINIAPVADSLWGTSTSGNNTIGPEDTLPAAFPKGHAAFYCMKYSITQGQYVEFLNLLTYAQQDSRTNIKPDSDAGEYLHEADRHAIRIAQPGVSPGTPAVYATDNPYVACNYPSWMDGAAYAQWAGLRPMTELEYEKACRGPATPVANEYAWGTNSMSSTGGSEKYSNLGEHDESVSQGNLICSGSNPGGPARVGIFATNNATRVAAGATYWGIMEMSGNLWERPVSVGHATTGRLFQGTHGDGLLSSLGHATRADWPGATSTPPQVTGAAGAGRRGGTWSGGSAHARASDRSHAANVAGTARHGRYGWRGVRSVPAAP